MNIRRCRFLMVLTSLTFAAAMCSAQQGAGAPGGAGQGAGAGRGAGGAARGPQVPPLLLTIPDFADGSELPVKFSCSGQPAPGVSPAMQWSQVPPGTQSF